MQKGYAVHVIAPIDYKTDELKSFHPIEFKTKMINPLNDFRLFLQLRKQYKKISPSFVFQYTIKPNIFGTIAARTLGIKPVAIITGLGYAFINNTWINTLVRSMYKVAFLFTDNVWFFNNDDIEFFSKEKLVSDHKVFHLPGEGVDTREFVPIEKTEAGSPRVFLMIARLLWDKGVKEYVEAATLVKKQVPDAVFQLLGPTTDTDNPSAILLIPL